MSVQTFYRLSVWLPLVVPGLVALVVHGAGLRSDPPLSKIIQVLLMSLMYGGMPYAVIAMWATFWIGRRPEPEIRRRALQAPLWTIAAFVMVPAMVVLGGGPLAVAIALFVLGAIAILGVGYVYVAIVFGLRAAFFGAFEPDPG